MNKLTLGIDEAGRGALAGPVVVCAAAILKPEACTHIQLNDSKAMTRASRIREYRKIKAAAAAGVLVYAYSSVSSAVVDNDNVLVATCIAADCATSGLFNELGAVYSASIKIDGNYNLLCRYNSTGSADIECIIKGDSKVPEIMLASIIAKVERDAMMDELDKQYPGYDFAQSKGYPSPKHMQAIIDKGPCAIHRKTFKRVKEYVTV